MPNAAAIEIPKPRTHQCRHLFTDGHQCGSCALRGEKLCFYHTTARRPTPHRSEDGLVKLSFPEPEDLHAVQRALGEVLRLLGERELDARDAGPILRTLAIASTNLARMDRQNSRRQAHHLAHPEVAMALEPVHDVVQDPILGLIALAPPEEHQSEAAPEAETASLAELLLAAPPQTVTPETLPDPMDVILQAHHLPTAPIALFEFAKRELALFQREFKSRKEPFTLSNGIPLQPLDLYTFALDRFDRHIREQGGNPDRLPLDDELSTPKPPYLISNEHFCTLEQIA